VNATLYPIPPRIRLRIGVSGHRVPPKLPADSELPLRALIDRILAATVRSTKEVEKEYVACAPERYALHAAGSEFAIVSSVAEGSDRIVAEAGLAAGFALEAVLPLRRAEYARDFETQASREGFEKLLGRASAVFELDGAAAERPRAYEAAGFVMLANIDLLIAIWDGDDASGLGGTEQIVSRAIADGIPVVWIEPTKPNAMHLSWPAAGDVSPANFYGQPKDTFRPADETMIALAVKELVALPTTHEARRSLGRYLGERERRWNFCPWYPLLLWLFSGRPLRRNEFQLPAALPETKAQWSRYLSILPQDRSQRPAIEQILLPAFSAADHLAVYNSLLYRSTYVFNFFFAAIAVSLALTGVFVHDPVVKSFLVIGELCIIVAIVVAWVTGLRQQSHRHWLEYRRLAESLRHMRILAPLGSEGPVARPSRTIDVDEEDWVNWYAWTVRRMLPLPDRVVDVGYLTAVRDAVRTAEIADQVEYHMHNAERIAKLDPRIHVTGQLLFGITGGLCLLFLGLVAFGGLRDIEAPGRELILGLFTFFSALLPTFGSAIGAIYILGDFKTVAAQSKRTARQLMTIDKILAAEPLILARLADRVEKASDVMMSDVLEWQIVFRTRPLSLPA
jgi:hypothetical protein